MRAQRRPLRRRRFSNDARAVESATTSSGGALFFSFIAAAIFVGCVHTIPSAASSFAFAFAFSPTASDVATRESMPARPPGCRSKLLPPPRAESPSLNLASSSANYDDVPPPPPSSLASAFRDRSDRARRLHAPKLERAADPSGDGVPGLAVVRTMPGGPPGAGGGGAPCISVIEAGEAAAVLPLSAALVVLAEGGGAAAAAADVRDWNGTGTGPGPGRGASAASRSPVPDMMDDRNWSAAPPQLRLAALLLNERRLLTMRGEGSKSSGSTRDREGYLRHLPPVSGPGRERCETLCRWTDAELTLLRSPALAARIAGRLAEEEEWYGRLMPGGKSKAGSGGKKVVSRAKFDWAVDAVRTRHFRGDFAPGYREPGSAEERRDDVALLPFIDDLNHRQTGAISPSKEFFPLKDCLIRTSDAVHWVAQRSHSPGDEMALSYLIGPDAIAEAFLDEWGFVPSPDCMDACVVYVGDVRCVTRGDGRLEDEEKRLEEIRKELHVMQQQQQQQQQQGIPTSKSAMARDKEEYGALTMAMPSDAEVWHRIAKACFTEAAVFESTPNAAGIQEEEARIDIDVSPRRRTIAESFVEGKWRLLRSGMQYALFRIENTKLAV